MSAAAHPGDRCGQPDFPSVMGGKGALFEEYHNKKRAWGSSVGGKKSVNHEGRVMGEVNGEVNWRERP